MEELITYLPYSDFAGTFKCLSDYDVGRQMHEAGLALDYIVGLGSDKLWPRRRVTRMWHDYPCALALYHSLVIREHVMRGGRPMRVPAYDIYHEYKIETLHYAHRKMVPVEEIEYPPWLGEEKLRDSHRAALLVRNPEHYGQFGWDVDISTPLWWPEGTEVESNETSRGFMPANEELRAING
jgi:hypothetical protein